MSVSFRQRYAEREAGSLYEPGGARPDVRVDDVAVGIDRQPKVFLEN